MCLCEGRVGVLQVSYNGARISGLRRGGRVCCPHTAVRG